MNHVFCFFAFLAAIVCVLAGRNPRIKECEIELGVEGKIVNLTMFKHYYPCITACVHEKMGVMIDNKIIPEKYINDYIPSDYSDYGQVYQPKLRECIVEANGQKEKCDVERSLSKCMAVHWKTIFPYDE